MVEIWIGSEQADYGGEIETQYSIGDFKSLKSGNLNTSYDFDLPLTDTNRRLLKYISEVSCFDEQTSTVKIIVDDIELLSGKLYILGINKNYAKCYVSKEDWMEIYKSSDLSALDLSAYDQEYNSTNVAASWNNTPEQFYRYPLIDFGRLDYGAGVHKASDFMPWFNVKKILDQIFKGYSITSAFINGTYFDKLFISARWNKVSQSFLSDTICDVKVQSNSDNDASTTVPIGGTGYVVSLLDDINFNDVINDPNGRFAGYEYQAPVDGTYKFEASIKTGITLNLLTQTSASYTINLRKDPYTGADVNLVTISRPTATIGTVETFDSGYIHLKQYDKITMRIQISVGLRNDDTYAAHTATVYVDTASTFKSIADDRCLLPGLGITIEPEKYLPEWTQYEFIENIKKMYNLRIWLDSWRKVIYIYPAIDYYSGDDVIDITNLVDNDDISISLLSKEYFEEIRLKFREDENDKALAFYNNSNELKLGEKVINLTSSQCKKGKDIYEIDFSTFVKGIPNYPIVAPSLPRIWGDYDTRLYSNPQERPDKFNVKIGAWGGYVTTSGVDWDYDGTSKTSYPKMDALDFATLYTTYFSNNINYIDNGKVIVLNGIADLLFIQTLNTVLVDSSAEGFRPRFKFYWQGEYHYGILNKYSTNGYRCKYELILVK